MARRAWWVSLVSLALLMAAASAGVLGQAGDEPPERDTVIEQEIHEHLGRICPEAVPLFVSATQALDAGALDTAETGFEQVLDLAPRFPDASRRLSQVELAQGEAASARIHAFQAYGYDPSPINLAAVAAALVALDDESTAGDAVTFARAAARALPEDVSLQQLHAQAAVAFGDDDAIRLACGPVAEIGHDDAFGHYCTGITLAGRGRWDEAERELMLALQAGMPEEEVEQARARGIRRRAWLLRWSYRAAWALLSYTLTPAFLFGAGEILGRLTMALASQSAQSGELRLRAGERLLSSAYRIVTLLASIWYYASIPLMWLALGSAWAGSFLLYYAGQMIWLRIILVLGIMAASYVLAAVYIGLTARAKAPGSGRPLGRDEAPRLWALAEDLADRLGTPVIDAVFVVPGAHITVQERGSAWELLRGKGRRCLVLGLGLLSGMTQRHFGAILAHEYAHFANRDTVGGEIAHWAHASVQRMVVQITLVGQNRWYSPGWWYVSVFTRIFMLVTTGASRLHEILADRAAAGLCGAEDFTGALAHITRQDYTLSAQVRAEMRLAKEESRQAANLYTLPPIEGGERVADLEAKIAKALRQPTARFDTHLSTRERIEMLARLQGTSEAEDRSGPVWELFTDPEGLQLEMTEVVRATVRRREDRLLEAVAAAHDEEAGRLRTLWRRATWWSRTAQWPWSRDT